MCALLAVALLGLYGILAFSWKVAAGKGAPTLLGAVRPSRIRAVPPSSLNPETLPAVVRPTHGSPLLRQPQMPPQALRCAQCAKGVG